MSEPASPEFDEPRIVAEAALRAAGGLPPGLFLDFDGTLAPIVDHPDAARLPPAAAAAIERLARRCFVAVVSGRAVDDVAGRVPAGLVLAGSHGYEIRGGGISQPPVAAPAEIERVARATAALEAKLAPVPGVLVENKRFAVAIHWRKVDDADVPTVEATVEAVAREIGGLVKTFGKRVFELRPELPWHKGAAVLWILERLPAPHFPVYVGDDVTDLDGLAAVREDGLGITVGDALPRDAGRFRLAGPAAVGEFLACLDRQLG
jgi:trehalose-phosphatase